MRQLAERKRTRDKVAVALGYEARRDHAPRVLAAGRGEIAEAILQAAKRSDVAIHVDHPLANALIKLELGEAIPPELYVAVAEVMAFLWRMECQKSDHGWAEPNTR